ncbi:MAG: hypothetical protein KF725_14795 [Cyclobacteriaceae bacterium]|nr:hypothetical protein [Cyclobacteriaceae bacterium]UYN87378.1 MAG: hypothetical protein KIT51_03660 [Cyclobacteriaceae bacterium]
MELRDLITTPLVLLLVYIIAYLVRPRVTDAVNRKYFFPALTLRIFGALALGFLYQFYYDGGDTFNYHTHGSRHVWEAFMDSPLLGWKLLTSSGEYGQGTYAYASQIPFYTDPSSFFVIRVAALFDLITFSSYSATVVFFAVISFCGAWALFIAFYCHSPQIHRWVALATLFVPSVIFWGSGLLKDTLTLAAVGILTYCADKIFIHRRYSLVTGIVLVLSVLIIYAVKKYILLCFLPALLLWIYADKLSRIRSVVVKILILPLIAFLLIGSGYYAIYLIGKDDARYSLDRIAITAQITAYDIGFYTGKDAGSSYSLGELDGTFFGMLSKAPEAINVSLFRPYIWEVKNPLMLLSALESSLLLFLTVYILYRSRWKFSFLFRNPTVIFCLVFSITFAFAVGVSTFNFGTLARYKIPLLPFYLLALIEIYFYVKSLRKLSVFERTE